VGVRQEEVQKTFRPEEEEVTGDWSKLHHEELRYLCSSSGIINVTKSRGMGWAGHVECEGLVRKTLPRSDA